MDNDFPGSQTHPFYRVISGSETNAGTFFFDKDGTGNYAITYNQIPKMGSSDGVSIIVEPFLSSKQHL